jgi:hypothetical protein
LTSSVASSSNYTILTALAQAAQTRQQQSQAQQLQLITKQIQKQLTDKIAALQSAGSDSSATTVLQSSISQVSAQKSVITNLQAQYTANSNVINDLQTQLANLQTAAQNGDSTSFDHYLSLANTDVGSLKVVTPNSQFQPDGVAALAANGLGIGSSASYGLSTSTGQSQALAAIQAAVQTVSRISTINGDNLAVAGGAITALTTTYNNYNTSLQAIESTQTNSTQSAITTLSAQATTQEHLIELALGNSQTLANQLMTEMNPPSPQKSVFGVLENSVGQTASSYQQQSNASNPILSLFA